MRLTIHTYPVFEFYESNSNNALQKGIVGAPAVKPKPKGNTRHHAKAVFKSNKVEHNINYNYNPPKATREMSQSTIKQLIERIGAKLGLLCSIKRSALIGEQSDSQITFSFVAFGFDEEAVLKLIPEFDQTIMDHGWDGLVVAIVRLDGSVERVDFTVKTSARYSGMRFDLNRKML